MRFIKKDEIITTIFEAAENEDVINKAYLVDKLFKINGDLSIFEKYYNEYKLQYNKQSVEKILTRRAVKRTLQILYDKGLFDNYAKTDKVLDDFLFVTRSRGYLEEANDDIQ